MIITDVVVKVKKISPGRAIVVAESGVERWKWYNYTLHAT